MRMENAVSLSIAASDFDVLVSASPSRLRPRASAVSLRHFEFIII